MNRKTLTVLVVALLALVIVVLVFDFTGNSPGKRGENPYELNIDEMVTANQDKVDYRETKNIPLDPQTGTAIDFWNSEIFIAGEGFIESIQPDGRQKSFFTINDTCRCIKVTDKFIVAGFEKSIEIFDYSGKIINSWNINDERTVITSVAVKENWIFVADAGNRKVIKYDFKGEKISEFEGKRDSDAGHGFIVPSAHFDLLVNNEGELWVVNPGEHAIENYTDNGELRGFWTKNSADEDGFYGCCNPAEIASMQDGSFITSEKNIVRIKVYDPSGKLISAVALPEKFEEQGKAPEVVEGNSGQIYALDFDMNTIRLFEKK